MISRDDIFSPQFNNNLNRIIQRENHRENLHLTFEDQVRVEDRRLQRQPAYQSLRVIVTDADREAQIVDRTIMNLGNLRLGTSEKKERIER